ncbi:serine/arginine repetitive matrix protein 3-like isoform X1 [Muntiacus reevesi]|uniref:serine/arginine repetitive matrix protein 3-like isoform X1 n=1 Tax=Muntiacus reevesi TaxID=9886 RepID=UPI0033077D24
MILLLVTYSPIAHSHPPPPPSFCDRSPRQAQAGAQRRRLTKPPPAAAGGCGAARLPAAPRLRRASKFVSAPAPPSLHTPSEYKGRQSRAEKQAEREGDREKEKRTWRETERVQEAARSERQGTGGSPAWTPGSRPRPPSDPGPEVLGARSQRRPISAPPDTSYYSPGSFGKRIAGSGSLSSLWKISLKLVFIEGYKQIPRSETVRTDAH